MFNISDLSSHNYAAGGGIRDEVGVQTLLQRDNTGSNPESILCHVDQSPLPCRSLHNRYHKTWWSKDCRSIPNTKKDQISDSHKYVPTDTIERVDGHGSDVIQIRKYKGTKLEDRTISVLAELGLSRTSARMLITDLASQHRGSSAQCEVKPLADLAEKKKRRAHKGRH